MPEPRATISPAPSLWGIIKPSLTRSGKAPARFFTSEGLTALLKTDQYLARCGRWCVDVAPGQYLVSGPKTVKTKGFHRLAPLTDVTCVCTDDCCMVTIDIELFPHGARVWSARVSVWPSIAMAWPEIFRPASLIKKHTMAAMSSVSTKRLSEFCPS